MGHHRTLTSPSPPEGAAPTRPDGEAASAAPQPAGRFQCIALISLLALLLVPVGMLIALPHRGWIDFYQIVTGADALWAGNDPYFWQFHSPPWFGVMLGPLLPLPYEAMTEVWFWLNLAALLAALWLWLSLAGIPRRSLEAATLVAAAATFAPTVHNLMHGQATLLAALALALLASPVGRSPAVAGLALALLTMKPQTAVLALLGIGFRYVLRREWAPLVWAAGIVGGLTAAALALRPPVLAEWLWSLGNGSLVTTGSPALYHVLKDAGLGLVAPVVAGAVALASAALMLRIAWQGRGKPVGADLVQIGAVASLLAAPYSHSYDYVVLLLPALTVIGRRLAPSPSSTVGVPAALFWSGLAIAYLLPLGPFLDLWPPQATLGAALLAALALWRTR
ncbi:MAG: glycosyltransferase 87 family protein [Chloroflexi bacterium]|nr:glycosyltransferase 87 family protein [Chloroflexota bacterium]